MTNRPSSSAEASSTSSAASSTGIRSADAIRASASPRSSSSAAIRVSVLTTPPCGSAPLEVDAAQRAEQPARRRWPPPATWAPRRRPPRPAGRAPCPGCGPCRRRQRAPAHQLAGHRLARRPRPRPGRWPGRRARCRARRRAACAAAAGLGLAVQRCALAAAAGGHVAVAAVGGAAGAGLGAVVAAGAGRGLVALRARSSGCSSRWTAAIGSDAPGQGGRGEGGRSRPVAVRSVAELAMLPSGLLHRGKVVERRLARTPRPGSERGLEPGRRPARAPPTRWTRSWTRRPRSPVAEPAVGVLARAQVGQRAAPARACCAGRPRSAPRAPTRSGRCPVPTDPSAPCLPSSQSSARSGCAGRRRRPPRARPAPGSREGGAVDLGAGQRGRLAEAAVRALQLEQPRDRVDRAEALAATCPRRGPPGSGGRSRCSGSARRCCRVRYV